MANSAIVVDGLAEFRAAIKRAEGTMPRELTNALKAAGVPIVKESGALSPRRTGRLAGGYRAQVRGSTGIITSSVPYAAGAEWGQRGKWKGFQRYGARGSRFAGKAVDTKAEEVMVLVYEGLNAVVTIEGWAT